MTYFSLDVEGAEDVVLEGTDMRRIRVLQVETLRDGPNATQPCMAPSAADCPGMADPAKEARVHALVSGWMRPVRRIWLPSDRLYARSSGQFEPRSVGARRSGPGGAASRR